MLGAGIGKVAPDFTPAARTITVLDTHEHCCSLAHGAEGGADRLADWHAKDVRLGARKHGSTHLFLVRLGEQQAIAERIDHFHHPRTPWLALNARLVVAVPCRC